MKDGTMSKELEFAPGEYAVYPTHGVGRITGIESQRVSDFEIDVFVLNFEKEKMSTNDGPGTKFWFRQRRAGTRVLLGLKRGFVVCAGGGAPWARFRFDREASRVKDGTMSKELEFAPGEYAVYPTHGVGRITGIESQRAQGAGFPTR